MTAERGVCPVCGEERQVTKAGGMRDHRGDMYVGGWRQQCEGVGQPPKSVVADPLVAAKAAGWREAIEALRDDEAWKAAQQALADEWHEDQCHCDAWPEDCRTYRRTVWVSGRDFAPSSWQAETVAPYFAAFLESLAPKETSND